MQWRNLLATMLSAAALTGCGDDMSGDDVSAATQIDTDDGAALSPDIAVDAEGNVVVVWEQDHLDPTGWNVWENRLVVGDAWGEAAPLSQGTKPQIAVDPAGNEIAVWYQNGSVSANRFEPATSWGSPVTISMNDPESGFFPSVAVDRVGNAIAVWSDCCDDGGDEDIWTARYEVDTGWAPPTQLDNGTSYPSAPQVGFDGGGNAIAVWQQPDPRGSIWARDFIMGVGWGPPIVIGGPRADAPRIVIDDGGDAIVVYRDDGIWATRREVGSDWATAESLGGNSYAGSPEIALDTAGNAVVVWSQLDVDMIMANRFEIGRGWTGDGLIARGRDPKVAFEGNGDAVAVWSDRDDQHDEIRASRLSAGVELWGDPALIAGNAYGAVVAGRADDVVIVWTGTEYDGFNLWATTYPR